jgi:ABC-type protease/lipase transport system fused ATPase/permease subunit
VEDLLGLLGRRAGLQRSSVASLKELTSLTDRAVCLPQAGPPGLLAAADQGGRIRVDFGGWVDPPLVREAALDGLFPCVALFVDGSGIPARRPVVRPGTLLGATLRFLSQLLGLALPLAMMLIIDKVVNQGAHNTLLVLLMGVALLTAFQFLFQWVHAVHVARTTELLAHPERVAGLDRVLGSSVAGELAMNGWEALQGALENGLYLTETRAQFYADVGFLVLLAVLMAAFDAVLLVVAVAVLPFCVAIEAWSSRRTRNASEVVSGLGQHLSGRYFELTAAARLLHAMNLGGHVVAQWQAHDTELALARHRLTLRRRVASLVVECLQRLSVLPVMLLGVTEVMQGSMTLGQYIAFNLLALQLGQPVLRLAGCWRARDDHQRRCDGREHLRRRCEETSKRWTLTPPPRPRPPPGPR